eukprot:TRINITY_DN1659_c0_g1_i1.p1 TRINITY_DN1659_c0_g1~~TRINITY_DN1659_c0_g1_i1.p1  ORF type:complete len:632 (-),score=200.62 TRINITY_DN1659_c0_g1_i1:57-1952(-)
MADNFDKRAFSVPDIDSYDPNSGPPQNGMDYLRSVILERRQQPKMFIAENPVAAPPKRLTALDQFAALLIQDKKTVPAPPGLAPDEAWEEECLANFQAARDIVIPKIEVQPDQVNIMDLLRSLAEEGEEGEGIEIGEGEGGVGEGEGEEMEGFVLAPRESKRKRKRSKSKKHRPQQHHWDACVERKPEEFDFEAELASFAMSIEASVAQKQEEREEEREGIEGEGVGEEAEFEEEEYKYRQDLEHYAVEEKEKAEAETVYRHVEPEETVMEAGISVEEKEKAETVLQHVEPEETVIESGMSVEAKLEKDVPFEPSHPEADQDQDLLALIAKKKQELLEQLSEKPETQESRMETEQVAVPNRDAEEPVQSIDAPNPDPDQELAALITKKKQELMKQLAADTEVEESNMEVVTESEQPKMEATAETEMEMETENLEDLIAKKKQELMKKMTEENSCGTKRKREEGEDEIGGDEMEGNDAEGTHEEAQEEEGTNKKKRRKRENKNGDPSERVLPHHKDEQAWKYICYGSDTRAAEVPTIELIQSMDPLTVITLISYHVSWIGEEDVMPYQANWIYHLMLKVEEPILRETASDLRDLRYRCSLTRSKLDSADHESLQPLNSIITLISRYFKVIEG